MSDEEETIASIPPPDTGEIEFGNELPVLPIRNAVLFPAAVAPFDVGREKSVALVEDIENLDQPIIAIIAQRDPSTDDPGQNDLYPVGVAARVLKALKHSSGNYSLILQGLVRIRLEQVVTAEPYIRARVSRLDEPPTEDVESEAPKLQIGFNIGDRVNIGAGTITCNYDGVNKHRTVIEDDVFIGSDTQLVAPVTIGKGADVGAGSTVTKDAPAEQLTISRAKQVTVRGWKRPKKKS